MSRQTQCTRALAFADQTRPVAAGQFQGIPRDAENGWATVPATDAPASPAPKPSPAAPRAPIFHIWNICTAELQSPDTG